jgi:hypothetical protein
MTAFVVFAQAVKAAAASAFKAKADSSRHGGQAPASRIRNDIQSTFSAACGGRSGGAGLI